MSEYQKHLSDVVQAEQVNIEHIVVTHWHHDHIGGVENLYGSIASRFFLYYCIIADSLVNHLMESCHHCQWQFAPWY